MKEIECIIRRYTMAVLMAVLPFVLLAQDDEAIETGKYTGNEWRTPEVFAQNRLPQRANIIPYDDENGIEKWDYRQSSAYLPLDEGWRVDYTTDYADRVAEIEDPSFAPSGWAAIELPDVRWVKERRQLRRPAFPRNAEPMEKGNATALYYNEFDVPKNWAEVSVILQLQPLSACYVWVNHHYVGYAEDGRSLAEFDISQHLVYGKRNSVAIQMIALSTSNLLDANRDMRHLGFSDVPALLLKGAVSVRDYALRADYSGEGQGAFGLDINVSNRMRKGRYYAEVLLWDAQGRQVEKMGKWFFFDKRSEVTVNIERTVRNVSPWSAETPVLYTAVIRVLDEKMESVETVGTRFGFRSVEVSGSQIMVNGRAVTLRGVQYADYTTDADGIVDYDLVEEHLRSLKNHNVNAIRTTLYSPADPRFYELCDELGFYVVCDANLFPFSTQGKAIATDNAYRDIFAARVEDMYERYKNHTSIIMWSLGESSDNGVCMNAAYRRLKVLDRRRPVIFAGAGYGESTDIIGLPKATIEQVRQYLSRKQSRPLLLMGYGASEGNSLGGLQPLWQQVENNALVQGGFFCRWNDVVTVDGAGREHYAHGLLTSSGSVAPSVRQLAYIYRPFNVALRSVSIDAADFSIANRSDFATGDDLRLEYRLYTSLKPSIISGEVPNLPDAGGGKDFKLMIPKMTLYAGEELFVRFSLKRRSAADEELYGEQFRLPMNTVERQPLTFDLSSPLRLAVEKSKQDKVQSLTVRGDYGETTIDMLSGEIKSYKYHGRELLSSPVRLNFWRLPTDNDLAEGSVARAWQQLHPDQLQRHLTDIAYRQIDSNRVAVDMMARYASASGATLMDVRQTLLFLSTGDIVMSCDVVAGEALSSVARVGVQMQVAKALDNVRWMGADIESYADRCGGVRIAVHEAKADAMTYRYHRPQEAGSRCLTRWVSLSDASTGLMVHMLDSLVSFSVSPYDDRSLSKADSYSKAKPANAWILNVDSRMSGIGSARGGLDISEKDVISERRMHFVAHLVAYDPTEYDPTDFCRIEYPVVSSDVLEMPLIERDRDRFDGPLTISISSPDKGTSIRYTLDGSDPTITSPLYEKPFTINSTTVIKARAFRDGDAPSFPSMLRCDYAYLTSVAYDRKPNTPYNHNSALALIDGVTGDVSDLSQGWIGFSGGSCGMTFQIAQPLDIDKVSLRFAHNPEAWIFVPREVKVAFSYDGTTFTDSLTIAAPFAPDEQDRNVPLAVPFKVKAGRRQVKALRIVAQGIERIPEWHRAKGLKPWIMTDEVGVSEIMK